MNERIRRAAESAYGLGIKAGNAVRFSCYERLSRIYRDVFVIGMSVDSAFRNPGQRYLISRCFDLVTSENTMKPQFCYDPDAEGMFRMTDEGRMVLETAKKRGIGVRFHTLVWFKQTDLRFFLTKEAAAEVSGYTDAENARPDDAQLAGREEMLERMKQYIRSAVEYVYANGFAETVKYWDVVNEAMTERGWTDSLWLRTVGPEYVYDAFLYAREAMEDCAVKYAGLYGGRTVKGKLFGNEHIEYYRGKRRNIIVLYKDTAFNADRHIRSSVIRADGDGTILGDGLVDGIGLQCHLPEHADIPGYVEGIGCFRDVFPEIHITELDIEEWNEDKAAELYGDLLYRLRKAKEGGLPVNVVTFWGMNPARSWRKGKSVMLFSNRYRRTKVFKAVVRAAKEERTE